MTSKEWKEQFNEWFNERMERDHVVYYDDALNYLSEQTDMDVFNNPLLTVLKAGNHSVGWIYK